MEANTNVGSLQNSSILNTYIGNLNISTTQNVSYGKKLIHSEDFLDEMEKEVLKHLHQKEEHSGRSSKQMWPFFENIFPGNLFSEHKVSEPSVHSANRERIKKRRWQPCSNDNPNLCTRIGNQDSDLRPVLTYLNIELNIELECLVLKL